MSASTVRVALVLLALLAVGAHAQQVMQSNTEFSLSLSVSPQSVRGGQSAKASVRMRNPYLSQQFTLQAVATFTDPAGVQQTVYSNPVTMTVDYSLRVRVSIPAELVRLVAGTARFDGVPIQPVSPNTTEFDVVLPGDGREHVLELEVTR